MFRRKTQARSRPCLALKIATILAYRARNTVVAIGTATSIVRARTIVLPTSGFLSSTETMDSSGTTEGAGVE